MVQLRKITRVVVPGGTKQPEGRCTSDESSNFTFRHYAAWTPADPRAFLTPVSQSKTGHLKDFVAPRIGRQSRPTKKTEYTVRFFQKNIIHSSTGQRRPLMETPVADTNIVPTLPPHCKAESRTLRTTLCNQQGQRNQGAAPLLLAGSLSLHRETSNSGMPPGQTKTCGRQSTTPTSSNGRLQ
ncbi:hypothetical protein CRE_29477 [Caenorhabditis remanei]|uniref:Uncharacterized protein n=1 Tax=Caenorhabditis remanei TaxID=31234 RepID=E3LV84_CAERE|nr:hypothetical protein CRE_29477 [Caenorhabditis remanei]